ncbi:MAG: hypothetical protein M1453_12350 [Acidobacteria bacterium]|nr:hypothetical protein [Acidobacteriota bacterium]MCL5288769.1 hypothetical protein [Acidobacteriota bacterium]
MPTYDADAVLTELKEEAVLPHPVKLRDLLLRAKLAPDTAVELNREFQGYLSHFGEAQKIAAGILEKLTRAGSKAS